MKIEPIAENETANDERWSLSWHPEERCDEFTREAILAHAPADSGVYGLFNFDYQIFIGEAANIQDILLHLERETDFDSQRLRPTGFTFELCPKESRKQRAAELIARHRPVLQTITASNALTAPPSNASADNVQTNSSNPHITAKDHELPTRGKSKPKVRGLFKRVHASALTIVLVTGAAGYYFLKPADHASISTLSARENSSAGVSEQPPELASHTSEPKPTEISAGTSTREGTRSEEEPTPGKADSALRLANASGADEVDVRKLSTIVRSSRAGAPAEQKWSVQVSSVPTKDVADRLAQELVAKGYAGYVVRAEVKGQAYYRVRAGRFAGREEAESTRESLARREGYRDAYVTGD